MSTSPPEGSGFVQVLRIDEEDIRRRLERERSRERDLSSQNRSDEALVVAELVSSRLGMRREPCASCGLPVFLAEKLVVERNTYHRSCFRCARCRHQLTPLNYYETEAGQYCCEACPDLEVVDHDDEKEQQPQPHINDNLLTTSGVDLDQHTDPVLEAPLSDEEKSKRRSLERASVEQLLRKQRAQLELVSNHLLGPAEDKVDGDEQTAPEPESDEQTVPEPESDEQKSAKLALPDNDVQEDDKFDEMIKRINERIDALTTDEEVKEEPKAKDEEVTQEEEAESPDTRPGRDARVNSAPDLEAEFKRANNDNKQINSSSRRRRSLSREWQKDEPAPALRRSSSLRSSSECTKEQPRRLSLVQRRLQIYEQSSEPVSQPPQSNKTKEKVEEVDDYPEELNPFASDVEDELEEKKKDKPPSTNPFGSSSDEETEKKEEQQVTPKPVARSSKRVLEAPKINLNPFWSDDEEPESGAESEPELRNKSPPVPRPRTLRHSHMDGAAAASTTGLHPRSNLLMNSSIHSSNTSIASACSTMTQGGTYRKKKPAPPPPSILSTPNRTLNTSSASSNPSLSPRLTPRTRKLKPAPPPPMATSTPSRNGHRIPDNDNDNQSPQAPPVTIQKQEQPQHIWDEEKLSKDEANRNTQSLSYNTDNTVYLDNYGLQSDKSLVDGKWKRKKGPAPPRPMPLRRKIKVMSMKDVKIELDQIEMQQQGLEKQGVRLEQIIRDKCESGDACEDTSLGMDVEELVLELFALVNEKNELFRRQAELMLLRRQQRLEEEHADIEYQVRCLISQPEATKTDFDKQREEALIQRLVEIVERRNEIVECLEMDRRREMEEDRSIHREMDLYAARNKADNINMTDESRRASKQKKGKIKEKTKEKKSKKSSKKDADKDVDETESKHKRHSLRKWF